MTVINKLKMRAEGYISRSLLVRHLKVTLLGKPIKVWFYREDDFLNFGDELTPDIIQKLFRKDSVRTSIEEADIFAVGSIIEVVNHPRVKKSYVWGSGFIREGESIYNKDLIFRAVRGMSSLSRIPKRYSRIPTGDPGLLSNLVYDTSSVKVTGKIGIIPHYVDEDSVIIQKAKLNSSRYLVISVKNRPEEVARQIAECSVILSSSLHGLIVSDSLGIPNIHMPLSDKVAGGDYKFKDYYSATERPYTWFDQKDLYNEVQLNLIMESYLPVSNLTTIQSRLIKSFPFK